MYFSQAIHGAKFMNFADYIPVNYHQQIMLGELHVHAFFEGQND